MGDRRTFLRLVGTAAAGWGLGCVGCGSTITDNQPAGAIKGGPAKDVPLNSLTPQSSSPVVIARDAAGLYAMTTVCTHQGCDIRSSGTINAAGLTCACHGSRFDSNGSVLNGPAGRALDHFAVNVDSDGNFVIQVGTVVSADTRTSVPG